MRCRMTERPVFTLKEAAEACQVSLKTIRRRRDKGDFPNSYRSASRAQSPWLIPVTDLIAAGLTPGKPAPPEEPPGPAEPSPTELDALKAENAELRKRAEIAEAVAEEREKALEDTRLALRAIAADLNAENVPTARGGSKWHASTVKAVLASLDLDAQAAA